MSLHPHGLRTGFLGGPNRADNLLALGHWNITPFQTPVASVVTATALIGGTPRREEYNKNICGSLLATLHIVVPKRTQHSAKLRSCELGLRRAPRYQSAGM